jgi:hypothetical protein
LRLGTAILGLRGLMGETSDVLSELLVDLSSVTEHNVGEKLIRARINLFFPSIHNVRLGRTFMSVNIGDWVLYALNADDVAMIQKQREDIPPNYNPVIEDQVVPALIVGVWGANSNLKVFLDGSDSCWIQQRPESREPQTGFFWKPTPWKPLNA